MVGYHILAERLVNLHTSLHPVPINQELSALDRGTFFALNYLMLHNHSAYPKDLSRSMGVSSARVAALLNHLEKEGFIQRRPDLKDNRQVIVSITDKGIQAICQKRERILDMIAQALESLGPGGCANTFGASSKSWRRNSCSKRRRRFPSIPAAERRQTFLRHE